MHKGIQLPKKKAHKEELWLISYTDLVTNLMALFIMLFAMSKVDVQKFDAVSKEVTGQKTHSLESLKKEIDAVIKKNNLQANIQTDLGLFGLNVAFSSGALFSSGSADIRADSYSRALPIFKLLAKCDPKYLLSLEGHTDDVPLGHGGRYRDNWDLSSARGVSLLNKLQGLGVPEKRMSVAGFASTRPKLPTIGKAGVDLQNARAANRRVVIRVYQ